MERMHAVDKSGMLSFCANAPRHYQKAAELAKTITLSYPKPDNVIIAGMGGSGIGGDLLKDWARNRTNVSIEVNREYQLPVYVGEKTLVVIVSYSGDTEESLSTLLDALRRKCMVYCISSGGALLKYAAKLKVPHLRVPSGMPPRAALPYLFMPLLFCMEKTGLVSGINLELGEALKILEKISADNAPEKPISRNSAKTLAMNIGETVPIVYGFGFYRSVAQRFKQQFNENSKSPAKWEFFSELDHNEIVGWEGSGNLSKYFSVILIRDNDEILEVKSRIETTKQIMGKANLKMFEVQAAGQSMLAKMLSLVILGDFTSVYLAILHGVDPTPVRTISFLKDSLKENGVRDGIVSELEKL
jgi:glucose/mannose-6-phosphate isomerase